MQRVRKRVLAHPLLVFYPSSMEITSPLFWTHLSPNDEKLIYISIYEGCVKVCVFIAPPSLTLLAHPT